MYHISKDFFVKNPYENKIFNLLPFALVTYKIRVGKKNGQKKFDFIEFLSSSDAISRWSVWVLAKGLFNNYVDKMRGGGVKKCLFLST